jgi:DNA polymerase (family 10)
MVDGDPTNARIADELALYAALLELSDASPFASRAYLRAADLIRSTPGPVAELVRAGRIRELRGVGPGIEAKLRELVETGEIAELRALQEELEPALVGFGRLLGVSGKRTVDMARALGVRTVTDLRSAIEDGRLQSVAGVGPATEARIRARLQQRPRSPRGLTLNRSRPLAHAIAVAVDGEIAGAVRRFAELAYEIDIVCATDRPKVALDRFESTPLVVGILERDAQHAIGVTVEGVPVRMRTADPARFGTELLRATGSAEYVGALEPLPDAPDEDTLYARLGVPYCPPELREAPRAAAPTGLVERTDVRGDLHCHTTWSDGTATVLEMARAAHALGYEYLAICDHTPSVRVVPGLDADALRRQGEEIAEVNELLAPFRVLRGVECDIRADGTLDVEEDVLAELDWVQLSLHAGQRRPRRELTRMVTEAMRTPFVRALSHPKGRILERRPENALDLDEVFAIALETGVALEVNGLPDRLDLSGEHVREAMAAGVGLVLNSDAHSPAGLERMELAVATARKGGAQSSSIANCKPLSDVRRTRPR